MTAATKTQRDLYEAAVIERLKESGFIELEIRTESLLRCGEGYQDEVINAGWHYWNAALSAAEPVKPFGYVYESTVRYFDGRSPQHIEEFEISETAVYSALSAQVQDVAGWQPPQDCDGKEQLAFETWAASNRYDMHEHPLHYLFMDPKTNAARQGWKAALQYVRDEFPAAPAKQDIAALETQLKHLITTRKNKAALAAFDNDTRMWFVAQLTGTASGRVPLTEIEALVARHLPPAVDDAPVN
jgi:hypothetical protein